MDKKKRRVKINWLGITWVILAVLSIVFFFIAINFVAFPSKYILPLGIVLALIDIVTGFFSLKRIPRRTQQHKKPVKRTVATIINCILCVALTGGSIYVPILESQMKGIFVQPTETQKVQMNAYVMTSTYKAAHPDVFTDMTTSTDIADYKEAKFITQTKVDQDVQTAAIEDIQSQVEVESLDTVSTSGPVDATSTLYAGKGDVMLMSSKYESSISEVPGYENFTTDTQVIYSIVKEVTVPVQEEVKQDYTNQAFMLFIAGSDDRDINLQFNTRTDTDLLLTVDPVNKQLLLVSLPRDWYVPNPALGDAYDKLTHLGNDGLGNSVKGLNEEFEFDYIKNYFEVNFYSFSQIIDALGGIDIYNPYEFSLDNGASVFFQPGFGGEAAGYVFEEGNLHLNGSQALSYVRERYNLPTGDLGRNEHQAIVMKAMVEKLTSSEMVSKYNNLLNSLQGDFLTTMSADDIYSLAQMQLNDGGQWSFITYHMSGIDGNDVTASLGDLQVYVSYPILEEVEFVKNEMNKIMNEEVITQGTMPTDSKTPYYPNN